MSNLFSCLWFNEVNRFTSRDQLSFAYTYLKLRRMNTGKPFHLNMFKDCERRAITKLFHHRANETADPPPANPWFKIHLPISGKCLHLGVTSATQAAAATTTSSASLSTSRALLRSSSFVQYVLSQAAGPSLPGEGSILDQGSLLLARLVYPIYHFSSRRACRLLLSRLACRGIVGSLL